jgi:hypothetical protein
MPRLHLHACCSGDHFAAQAWTDRGCMHILPMVCGKGDDNGLLYVQAIISFHFISTKKIFLIEPMARLLLHYNQETKSKTQTKKKKKPGPAFFQARTAGKKKEEIVSRRGYSPTGPQHQFTFRMLGISLS